MKMTKKILSFVLVLAMMMTVMSGFSTVRAEENGDISNVNYIVDIVDYEDKNEGDGVPNSWYNQSGDVSFQIAEANGNKVARLYRGGYTSINADMPESSALSGQTSFVYEIDVTLSDSDSEWKFIIDQNYQEHEQWIINRNGQLTFAGIESGVNLASGRTYRLSWYVDFSTGTQTLYVDGVQVGEPFAINTATGIRCIKVINSLDGWGAQNINFDMDHVCAYEYNETRIVNGPAGAEPTEAPEATEEPEVTEEPESGNVSYVVDSSASTAQNTGDYHYNMNGVTVNADGYSLNAASGDFEARVWANGCPLGNTANSDGVTVAFTAGLPESNQGRVYYGYSGAQDQVGYNPFFGFKPVEGGYRLLSNLSSDDATDEFYNEKIYFGDVPVIVYITADSYELYVDGEKIATVPVTDVQLGSRWYYTFFSYYAGSTATTLEVKDLQYLTGKAIIVVEAEEPTEVPATEVPTEAPTAAPTEAVVIEGHIYENNFDDCAAYGFWNTDTSNFNNNTAAIGFTATDVSESGTFGIQTVNESSALYFVSGTDGTSVNYVFAPSVITDDAKLNRYQNSDRLQYTFDFGVQTGWFGEYFDFKIGDETLIHIARNTNWGDIGNVARLYYNNAGTEVQSPNYINLNEVYGARLVVDGTDSLTYDFYITDRDGYVITICEDVPMKSTSRGDFAVYNKSGHNSSGWRNGAYQFIDNFVIDDVAVAKGTFTATSAVTQAHWNDKMVITGTTVGESDQVTVICEALGIEAVVTATDFEWEYELTVPRNAEFRDYTVTVTDGENSEELTLTVLQDHLNPFSPVNAAMSVAQQTGAIIFRGEADNAVTITIVDTTTDEEVETHTITKEDYLAGYAVRFQDYEEGRIYHATVYCGNADVVDETDIYVFGLGDLTYISDGIIDYEATFDSDFDFANEDFYNTWAEWIEDPVTRNHYREQRLLYNQDLNLPEVPTYHYGDTFDLVYEFEFWMENPTNVDFGIDWGQPMPLFRLGNDRQIYTVVDAGAGGTLEETGQFINPNEVYRMSWRVASGGLWELYIDGEFVTTWNYGSSALSKMYMKNLDWKENVINIDNLSVYGYSAQRVEIGTKPPMQVTITEGRKIITDPDSMYWIGTASIPLEYEAVIKTMASVTQGNESNVHTFFKGATISGAAVRFAIIVNGLDTDEKRATTIYATAIAEDTLSDDKVSETNASSYDGAALKDNVSRPSDQP